MNYTEACKLAFDYFVEKSGIRGLSTATENGENWFFSAGKDSAVRIGNTVIAVSKSSGTIRTVNMLSKEDFQMLRNSALVEIPEAFSVK